MSELSSSSETPFTAAHAEQLRQLLSQDDTPTESEPTPADIDRWISQATDGELFDAPVTLHRDGQDTTVTVEDAVYARRTNDQGAEERRPVVIVRHSDGTNEELPAADFLRASGFDVHQFRADQQAQQAARADAARAAIAQADSDSYDRARHELDRRTERHRRIFAPEQQLKPTPATHQAAERNLQTVLDHDPDVAQIMRTYQTAHPGFDPQPAILVDTIHDDAQLRLSLGTHFLDLVDRLPRDQMPSRIHDNAQKSPRVGQLPLQVTSREYVARLCLLMLDGTYNDADEAQDIDLNHRGVATLGQHRFTAKTILHLPFRHRQPEAA